MLELFRGLFLVVVVAGSLAVWSEIVAKWRRGEPLVAWQPRWPVPWTALHVLLGITIYLGFQTLGGQIAYQWSRGTAPEVAAAKAPADDDHNKGESTSDDAKTAVASGRAKPTASHQSSSERFAGNDDDSINDAVPSQPDVTAHPLARLIVERRSVWVLILALAAAAVVAPLTEEFFFRVLIGGWLEAHEPTWRRRLVILRLLPRGTVPIVGSALPFALAHARGAQPEFDATATTAIMTGITIGNVASLAAAVALVRSSAGASWQDLGISVRQILPDAVVGVKAVLAILIPMYLVQLALYFVFLHLHRVGAVSEMVAPDPVPIFLLALVLGYLYFRTHRYAPSVIAHMTFNATSLALVLLVGA